MRRSDLRPEGRFRTPLLVALVLLLVFSVLSLSLKRSPALNRVEGLVIAMTAPGASGHGGPGTQPEAPLAGVFFPRWGLRQENAELKQHLQEYEQKEVVIRRPSRP